MEAKNESTIIGTADTYTVMFDCDSTDGQFINCYSVFNSGTESATIEISLFDDADTLLVTLYKFALSPNTTFERKVMTPIQNTQQIKIKSTKTGVHAFLGYAII